MEMVLAVIKKTINFEGHQNCITGSRVTRFCGIGEFCLLAEFHREESAPADLFPMKWKKCSGPKFECLLPQSRRWEPVISDDSWVMTAG